MLRSLKLDVLALPKVDSDLGNHSLDMRLRKRTNADRDIFKFVVPSSLTFLSVNRTHFFPSVIANHVYLNEMIKEP